MSAQLEELKDEYVALGKSIRFWKAQTAETQRFKTLAKNFAGSQEEAESLRDFLDQRQTTQKRFYKFIQLQKGAKSERTNSSMLQTYRTLKDNLSATSAKISHKLEGRDFDEYEFKHHQFFDNLRRLATQ